MVNNSFTNITTPLDISRSCNGMTAVDIVYLLGLLSSHWDDVLVPYLILLSRVGYTNKCFLFLTDHSWIYVIIAIIVVVFVVVVIIAAFVTYMRKRRGKEGKYPILIYFVHKYLC